jgi:hypothetical protein
MLLLLQVFQLTVVQNQTTIINYFLTVYDFIRKEFNVGFIPKLIEREYGENYFFRLPISVVLFNARKILSNIAVRFLFSGHCSAI